MCENTDVWSLVHILSTYLEYGDPPATPRPVVLQPTQDNWSVVSQKPPDRDVTTILSRLQVPAHPCGSPSRCVIVTFTAFRMSIMKNRIFLNQLVICNVSRTRTYKVTFLESVPTRSCALREPYHCVELCVPVGHHACRTVDPRTRLQRSEARLSKCILFWKITKPFKRDFLKEWMYRIFVKFGPLLWPFRCLFWFFFDWISLIVSVFVILYALNL